MQINLNKIHAEVTEAFSRYERALVSNDVEELNRLFWQSPEVVRYGARENLYGIDEIRAFRAARPSADLARTLTRTVITTFGTDYATAMTEFTREGTSKIGRQSHSWVRAPDGWKIVAAHVSIMS